MNSIRTRLRMIAAVTLSLAAVVLPGDLNGQSHIMLDEQLKAGSEPMPVKRKGISAIGKYEFGSYRIISGKEGWTTTREKSDLFGRNSRIESKTRKSFVFTGNNKDTVRVNISVSSLLSLREQYGWLFRELTGWSDQVVTESAESYIAGMETTTDTATWNLILAYPVGDEIEGPVLKEQIEAFQGVLTNGDVIFNIRPVLRWEDGTSATLLKPVEGYEFILNNESLAAVQVFPANKMFVWIRSDLESGTKLILAASAAAFLVRSY